jgi:hypothetical protein
MEFIEETEDQIVEWLKSTSIRKPMAQLVQLVGCTLNYMNDFFLTSSAISEEMGLSLTYLCLDICCCGDSGSLIGFKELRSIGSSLLCSV